MDLLAAFGVLVILATGGGLAGVVVGRRASKRAALPAAALAATGIAAYLGLLRDSYLLTRLLPVPALPVLGDALPILACFLAGVAWPRMSASPPRRAVWLAPVVLLAFYGPVRALWPDELPCRDRWDRGVCRQTTSVTCVPAAAATLLAHYAIPATEPELARLCLTTWDGTHLFGLFRGLTLKARAADLRVRVEHVTLPELRALEEPVILCMELTPEVAARDRRYAEQWGWVVGVMHTVVLYGFDDDAKRVVIGDPGAGRERWGLQALNDLWTGEVVRLVPER